MTSRTTRTETEIEPGVHLLRAQNDEHTVVLLVVRDGKLEVWLQQNVAPQAAHTGCI